DVCLVLLIFFMLTTSYVTAVQKLVPLPTVSPDKKQAVKVLDPKMVKQFMVRVDASTDKNGQLVVRVENQPVKVLTEDGKLDGPKLTAALAPYVRGNPPKTEMLLDARDISWGTVIAI